ncbi:MAG: MFS transporter [Alphaproteobacteria bacterium]|nr:MFS transporter [Alphaproteobacteria bacterium]
MIQSDSKMIKNIRLLYIHNFLNDFRFHNAFLAIYFAQITGSYTVAMSVFAIATVTSAIMDIPTGILSDKMGRKFTVAFASICSTLSVALYAFAHNKTVLLLGGSLGGLSECLFNGNNNAFMYESLKAVGQESQFHHYQGRANSMFQLGLGLSALAATFLVSGGLRFVFLLGIIPQALSVFVSFMFHEPDARVDAPKKSFEHLKQALIDAYRNPRLLFLIAGQAISFGANESKFQFQTAYFNILWPTWALGLYRAMGHSLGFIGFWLSGHIIDRFKETPVLIFREIYWLISQTIGIILSNVITPIFFLSGSVFFGPGVVARDHLLQKQFTDEQRATMGSIASFAGSIVFAILAFCIGIIADKFGLAAGVGFGVVMSATSLPFYMYLFRKSAPFVKHKQEV